MYGIDLTHNHKKTMKKNVFTGEIREFHKYLYFSHSHVYIIYVEIREFCQ